MIKTNNPEINVEELIKRISVEVAQQKSVFCENTSNNLRFCNSTDSASDNAATFTLNLPNLKHFNIQPSFNPKSDEKYHLQDLLAYHDQTFINMAYRAILCRCPDPDGNFHYLNMLRNGYSKVDILGRFRYCKEGRSKGVKIAGLFLPFLFQQIYRIRVFGRLVQILSVIWHLPHLERNQRMFENHSILLMEQSKKISIEFCGKLNQSLLQLEKGIRQLQNDTSSLLKNVKDDQSKFEAEHIQTRLILNRVQEELTEQNYDIARNLQEQDRRLGILLEVARKRLPDPILTEQIEAMLCEDDHRLDTMYAGFEDRFRGSREDIKKRQSIYLPIVLESKAGTMENPILDLGCGRGEWLELLHQEGLTAKGVDLNRVFLEGCRKLGLEVVEQEAVSYLRGLKTNSVRVVTAFHLIEHIPFKTLIAFIDEIFRVLQPGGLIVFETPNPENVRVGSCNFYLDPTHQNPLPPPLTKFLIETRGFSKIRVMPLHPFPDETVRNTSENTPFRQYFMGPQDYAVIGWKG